MNYFLLIEHDHISKFEIKNLMPFTDSWCEKLADLTRKKESLLARFLVNKLCKKLEIGSIHECGFKKDSKGRPYLFNYPNLFLSITHCQGFVFVTASNSPVGIDFEKIDPISSEDLKIAFNELDWKIVSADINSMFKYFSLKESYSKMIGTGFTTEPAEIQLVDIEKNSYYSFFEINGLRYVFTIITLHIEPEKFLNLQFNFSS